MSEEGGESDQAFEMESLSNENSTLVAKEDENADNDLAAVNVSIRGGVLRVGGHPTLPGGFGGENLTLGDLTDDARIAVEWASVDLTQHVGKSYVYNHVYQVSLKPGVRDSQVFRESKTLQRAELEDEWVCMLCKEEGKELSKCFARLPMGKTTNPGTHLKSVHPERLMELMPEVTVLGRKRKSLSSHPSGGEGGANCGGGGVGGEGEGEGGDDNKSKTPPKPKKFRFRTRLPRGVASARSVVTFPPDVLSEFQISSAGDEMTGPKGRVFETAKIAGIMGAKKTSDLIPQCYPLPLERVGVEIHLVDNQAIVECEVLEKRKKGGEMEALTGASIAALTIFDMVKDICPEVEIGQTALVSRGGGGK